MRKVSLRMWSLLRRNSVDAELDEELRLHLERQIAQNLAVGMSGEEARYAALREFGGVDQTWWPSAMNDGEAKVGYRCDG